MYFYNQPLSVVYKCLIASMTIAHNLVAGRRNTLLPSLLLFLLAADRKEEGSQSVTDDMLRWPGTARLVVYSQSDGERERGVSLCLGAYPSERTRLPVSKRRKCE